MGREPGIDAVAPVLQRYADRSVFRGFSAASSRGGRREYRFTWLMNRPMSMDFRPKQGVVSVRALFPSVGSKSSMAADLSELVAARHGRDLPAHKRCDARRARIACAVTRGDFGLTLTVRGHNHEYGVQKVLNLINELFLLLQEKYPEYLIERFGLSTE